MSLARALTTMGRRPRKTEADGMLPQMSLGRAASQRAGRPILRAHISSPVALVSTSNLHVHEAPSIAGTLPIEMHHVADLPSPSAASSVSGGDDSDASSLLCLSPGGSEMITDASSIDEAPSPSSCTGPEPNHLSCYFQPAVDTSGRSRASTLSAAGSPDSASPRIPRRVPSHSKKAHERVHRTRSLQRIMSPVPASRRLQDAVRSSDALPAFVEAPERESPFGQELAQLDEIAEEFGQAMHSADVEGETAFMREHGLACFSAADYCVEIDALVRETFGVEAPVSAWI